MKKLLLAILAVVVLFAPVVMAQTTDSKSLTIAATWTGGVTVALDKVALTFPTMALPHDGAWYNSNEGTVTAAMSFNIALGHRIRFSMKSTAWTPALNGFGPETTVRLIGVGEGMVGLNIPAPAVGAETDIFVTGTILPLSANRSFNIEVKNVNVVPNSHTSSLTFFIYDII